MKDFSEAVNYLLIIGGFVGLLFLVYFLIVVGVL